MRGQLVPCRFGEGPEALDDVGIVGAEKRNPDLATIGFVERWQGLAPADGGLDHQVHAETRALNLAAGIEGFGEGAVAPEPVR